MYEKRPGWVKHLDFVILDMFSVFLSIFLSHRMYLGSSAFGNELYKQFLLTAVIADAVVCMACSSFKRVLKRGYLEEFLRTLQNCAVLYAFMLLYFFATKNTYLLSRGVFFGSIIAYCLISFVLRAFWKMWLRSRVIPNHGRSLFIVTTKDRLGVFEKNRANHHFDAYRMAGIAVIDGDDVTYDTEMRYLVRCTDKEDVIPYIRANWVDEVLIDIADDEERSHIMSACIEMGISVHIALDFMKDVTLAGTGLIEGVCGYDVLTMAVNEADPAQMLLKRIVDILGGLVGMFFTLILTLFVGPAIYIQSPGPIFFKQPRIGKNGKVFNMYKFRSMYPDAEERKKEFMDKNRLKDGMMFKLDFDPRIIGNKELEDGTRKTGLGQFIRDTSIDEFPQFFNVLKGDMSLIGTRPPTLDEWVKYEDHHRFRMAMRPGITGLWQVSGRSEITDFEEVVKLDGEYIANWSLLEDIKILGKTVKVVLKREGSM